MKINITCEDKYEAQKLASLIFIKEGNETYITGILNVVKNELVISLEDKSAHSILLENEETVENFADFISPIGPNGALSPSMEMFDADLWNSKSESMGLEDIVISCKSSTYLPSVAVTDIFWIPRIKFNLKFTISSNDFPIHLSGLSSKLVSPWTGGTIGPT